MAIIKASITQARVLGLLQKDFDGTYDMAARLLEEMGLPKNGVPAGHTPGSVKKISDEELLALLPEADTSAQVLTREEAQAAEKAERAKNRAELRARAAERAAEYNKPLNVENGRKVIYYRQWEFADIGGKIAFPSDRLPREDFDRLYQGGAMYIEDEDGDGEGAWVIHMERAEKLGYTCKTRGEGPKIGFQDEIEG